MNNAGFCRSPVEILHTYSHSDLSSHSLLPSSIFLRFSSVHHLRSSAPPHKQVEQASGYSLLCPGKLRFSLS